MTEQELKDMWVYWVKSITGVSVYYLSPMYNRYFKKAVQIIDSNKIEDVHAFIRSQIQWACNRNTMITPLLLAGNSFERYRQTDPYDKQVREAKNSFKSEYRDFYDRKNLYGFDHAIRSHLEGHSPLFILYVTLEEGKEVTNDMKVQAARQLMVEPAQKEVYPEWLIDIVTGGSHGN